MSPSKIKNYHKYDKATRFFHWIMAIFIIYVMLTGMSLHLIDPTSTLWSFISKSNISLAFFSFLFLIPRWIWSFFRQSPNAGEISQIQINIAHFIHSIMYLLMFIMYISGFLMLERNIFLLGIIEYKNPFISAKEITTLFFQIHLYSCYFLFIIIIIHILAVIKHKFIYKNKILNKMTF